MVKAEIIQRVLLVKYKDAGGTAFTLEKDSSQYIVSAKHVFPALTRKDKIEIFVDSQWEKIEVVPIFPKDNSIDIVAFKLKKELTVALDIELGSKGLIYSQDAFFLGYPYSFKHRQYMAKSGSPIPIVKKAIVSALLGDAILLDGNNNVGFSGAPVVINNSKNKSQIVAVISGYYPDPETGENSGIIKAYALDAILDAIDD